jgi:hypothetical protein
MHFLDFDFVVKKLSYNKQWGDVWLQARIGTEINRSKPADSSTRSTFKELCRAGNSKMYYVSLSVIAFHRLTKTRFSAGKINSPGFIAYPLRPRVIILLSQFFYVLTKLLPIITTGTVPGTR